MHATASTSTHSQPWPTNRRSRPAANRQLPAACSPWRQESPPESCRIQDTNVASYPFAFVPRRRSGNENSPAKGLAVNTVYNNIYDPTTAPSLQLSNKRNVSPTDDHISCATFPLAKCQNPHPPLPVFNVTDTSGTSTPTSIPSPDSDSSEHILIRKKSGQVLKPSLRLRTRTKSAPSTPGSKAVHFDAKLEHVRLFRARQTPRAISRDGSPTETSEGETSEGGGSNGFPFPTMKLCLYLGSLPPAKPPPTHAPWTFNVHLERLSLDDAAAALVGHVLVRNIAFAKRVAVRFTMDAWQTTSEVAAHYIESIRTRQFDRFEFRVRLADYRAGKVVLCVRYAVAESEFWDNNDGRNYEVLFEHVCAEDVNSPMADLRVRLENLKVVQDGAIPRRKRAHGLRVCLDNDAPSRRTAPPVKDGALSLRDAALPLSARYDFNTSLKSPIWTPPQSAEYPAPPRRHHAHAVGMISPPALRKTPPSHDGDTASAPSTTDITVSSPSPKPELSLSPLSPSAASTYHTFLDKFCFFTGAYETCTPRRTHSAPNVGDYFSHDISAPAELPPPMSTTSVAI